MPHRTYGERARLGAHLRNHPARGRQDGPQLIRSSGARWADAAEAVFLDHLAASCNVTAAAEATGVSELMKERAEMSVRVL